MLRGLTNPQIETGDKCMMYKGFPELDIGELFICRGFKCQGH